jgi:hypothetical protein
MAGDHLVEVGFADRQFSLLTYFFQNEGQRTLPEIRL